MVIDDSTNQAALRQLADTGLFKLKTQYITVGDEVAVGKGVVDLKKMLKAEQYAGLLQYLSFMPRSMLWTFFMQKIWPGLPNNPVTYMDGIQKMKTSMYGDTHGMKQFEDLVWAAFIDAFNIANLKYVNDNQMEPWDWEEKKTNAYYISTSDTAIYALANEIQGFQDVSLALDPQAKKIMEAYALLPKYGDIGLEINRQNAVKEILKKREYATAQAVIDAFRYISKTELGPILTKKIPFNIVTESGKIVAEAT